MNAEKEEDVELLLVLVVVLNNEIGGIYWRCNDSILYTFDLDPLEDHIYTEDYTKSLHQHHD